MSNYAPQFDHPPRLGVMEWGYGNYYYSTYIPNWPILHDAAEVYPLGASLFIPVELWNAPSSFFISFIVTDSVRLSVRLLYVYFVPKRCKIVCVYRIEV